MANRAFARLFLAGGFLRLIGLRGALATVRWCNCATVRDSAMAIQFTIVVAREPLCTLVLHRQRQEALAD